MSPRKIQFSDNTDKKPSMINSTTSSDSASTIDTSENIHHKEFLSSESSQAEPFSKTIDILDDLNYERQIFDVLKNIPENNPDGSPWRMFIGDREYSKEYIMANWSRDSQMRTKIRKILLSLKFHKINRT